MPELDWEVLVDRIHNGKCTPFLGAGATHGLLPGGAGVAQQWARAEEYPLKDDWDLARVSQFLAVSKGDASAPKEKMCALIEKTLRSVDLAAWLKTPGNPIAILAELPLPVYLTTNYDNLMFDALRAAGKEPRIEICRWNRAVMAQPSVFERKAKFAPSKATPLVFHLHGHISVPDSLVLTEDDYFDFLLAVARDDGLLPPRIIEALTGTSLLFVGYRLADVNFRVLFRGLVASMEGVLRRMSVAVQLPPDGYAGDELQRVQNYLDRYFDQTKVRVYWGDASQFLTKLKSLYNA